MGRKYFTNVSDQMDHLPFWSLETHSDDFGYGQGTKEIIEWMAERAHRLYRGPTLTPIQIF